MRIVAEAITPAEDAVRAYGYRPALCESHGACFAPHTFRQVPHWTELESDDEPVLCEGCAQAIMRRAGVL